MLLLLLGSSACVLCVTPSAPPQLREYLEDTRDYFGIGEFLRFHLVELLLAFSQVLESLAYRLGHLFVRLLGSAEDGKLLSFGDAYVSIVAVKSESKQMSLAFCFWFGLSWLHVFDL